ncbi:ulp1 protease family, C-terminal catalytic domain-containing protein [Tanacetum coccineum]|uniref:Ulp1 protease family, C-terminal catalytic domain-containing protein n=1 Tax=Tanacetum coccineum TaxID=301880 RepID=A0ABQ5FID8_9ASTR
MLIISIQFSSPYNNISVPIQCDNFLIDLAFNLLVKESVFFVAAFPPNLFSIASINSLASLIELNFNCGSLVETLSAVLIFEQPAETDWAIVGPFFNTFMLRNELSCCYADSVTYGVPWFDQSVKKVLDKKNIDPANYSITYRYAVNVPRQGDAYGDCGIWVMRNIYMLVNNLSSKVSNPTQLGLAYREWLTDFF